MKLVGTDQLDKFVRQHAEARRRLQAWRAEAESARWKTPQDIKNQHQSASFVAGDRVIFNIGGNNYRLVVKALYQNGVLIVEWVGTHKEYDRKSF